MKNFKFAEIFADNGAVELLFDTYGLTKNEWRNLINLKFGAAGISKIKFS